MLIQAERSHYPNVVTHVSMGLSQSPLLCHARLYVFVGVPARVCAHFTIEFRFALDTETL